MNLRTTFWRSSMDCKRERMDVVKKVSCMQPGQKSIKKLVMAGRPYWNRLRICAFSIDELPISPPFCTSRS